MRTRMLISAAVLLGLAGGTVATAATTTKVEKTVTHHKAAKADKAARPAK